MSGERRDDRSSRNSRSNSEAVREVAFRSAKGRCQRPFAERKATYRTAYHTQGETMSKWLVAVLFGVSIAISIGCSTAGAADDHQPAASVYAVSSGRLGA